MIERDYIMRLIQQFSIVLSRILFNVKIENYDQALREIEQAYRTLLNRDQNFALHTPLPELIAEFETRGERGWEQAFIIAELLRQEGEICELKGDLAFTAETLYAKSLALYSALFEHQERYKTGENRAKAAAVAGKLRRSADEEVRRILVLFDETNG